MAPCAGKREPQADGWRREDNQERASTSDNRETVTGLLGDRLAPRLAFSLLGWVWGICPANTLCFWFTEFIYFTFFTKSFLSIKVVPSLGCLTPTLAHHSLVQGAHAYVRNTVTGPTRAGILVLVALICQFGPPGLSKPIE